MIALRVEDDYGDAVVVTILAHEGAAVVDVDRNGRRAGTVAGDLMLDAADLRDLARIATLAADELDRTGEVTP